MWWQISPSWCQTSHHELKRIWRSRCTAEHPVCRQCQDHLVSGPQEGQTCRTPNLWDHRGQGCPHLNPRWVLSVWCKFYHIMAFPGDAIRICKLVTFANLPPCSTAERRERSPPKGRESQSWDSTQLPPSLLALVSASSLATCVLQEFPSSIYSS